MIITLQTLIFFRESLLNALDRLLRPYYKKFSLTFSRKGEISDDEEAEEQVFAEYDDERGVVFYPPMYVQRYAAVSDCLMDERWCGKLEKVVDIGYHDMSFIKYLKEVPGINCILGVDIESIPLRCSSDLIGSDDYIPKRENPLKVTLFKGNAADPDYRLIGCDAVVAIEMIEHMLPHDLDRLIHTVFGFIKPMIAVFTTPNADFNVLFKSLEKNGLRRLDHFFEWSREQFHDWCSNIVTRYPQYTVSCKGIGPGPPDTLHLGCCSQMALFINNDYSKQRDLNINSLALVSNTPSPNSISNLISSWESCDVIPNESKMIALEQSSGPMNNLESSTDLNFERQSSITLVLSSSYSSSDSILFQDKMSQCNLDSEVGRNYLMFDYEQMCFDLVMPRRSMDSKVYVIEDVNSRLNCTTFQVKKFSKTTQNLMAKHKLDSLVHTREVVDEIRHLTKMLNFNRKCLNQPADSTTWCNINWGENAPYWNQYYKVVREYNYPFETKSDECRILELISDEINRLVDQQFDDELSMDMNRLEIPIEHLMSVVEHFTDDVNKVKDLLEWNGYEVSGNTVIHSRLVMDNASLVTQDLDDWQETDTYSDWDSTDLHSTSMSDGSNCVQDYHATTKWHYKFLARCLRRALDQKVRKLRSMLTADEDITTELDQVVCRLMKLALSTSKGRQTPPPTRWMQCKLLDLLTLTEKSIERRKRYVVENYPLKAIGYEQSEDRMALEKIKEDDTAMKIVDKYEHLVKPSDDDSQPKYQYLENLEDKLSVSSGDFVEAFDLTDRHSPSLCVPEPSLNNNYCSLILSQEIASKLETKLERTQAWVEDDIEVVPYPDHDNFDNSSGDTDKSVANIPKYYKKKGKNKSFELKCVLCKKSHSKTFNQKYEKRSKDNNCKTKTLVPLRNISKTKLSNKETRNKSSHNNLGKTVSNKYVSADGKGYKIKPRRKNYKTLYPTDSKPIPPSLVNIFQPQLVIRPIIDSNNDDNINTFPTGLYHNENENEQNPEVATTKQSLLISIVTDNAEEVIALRRTIGTDSNVDPLAYEEETVIRSVSNSAMKDDNLVDKHHVSTENNHSQTIFLYDIDEPTTSKGIRHTSMDVQCGPDTSVPAYSSLSPTTSLSRMPEMFATGIQIGESTTDTQVKNVNFSTCTCEAQNIHKTIQARERTVGIKIKDSDLNVPSNLGGSYSIVHGKTTIADYDTVPANNSNCKCDRKKQMLTHMKVKPVISQSLTDINTDCYCRCTNDMYEVKPKRFGDFGSITRKQTTDSNSPSRTIINTNNTDFEIFARGSNNPTEQVLSEDKPVIDELIKDLKPEDKTNCSTNTSAICNGSHEYQQEPFQTKIVESKAELKNDSTAPEIDVSSFIRVSPKMNNSIGNCKRQNISMPIMDTSGQGKQCSTHVNSRLCLGGTQVHSFRDKQVSEDIMYQGEWQKNKPVPVKRKRMINYVIPKKTSDYNLVKRSISKEKVPNNKNNRPVRRSSLPRDTKISNIKPESHKNDNIKINQKCPFTRVSVVPTVRRPFRNVVKVPSKTKMSSVSSKATKPAYVVKQPPLISNLVITKNVDNQQNSTKKHYIPLYLKRRISKSANDDTYKKETSPSLNLSLDSAKLSPRKEPPKNLIRSKTVEIKRDLLKFQTKTSIPTPNIVVFRNEIEQNNSDKQQIKDSIDTINRKDTSKPHQFSSNSANSSTCSSPNSVATVRSFRPKKVTSRRFSTSSSKMNTASESENTTPDRNKKVVKRSRSAKTPDKTSENKENIPQSSKQNNIGKKESNTFGKGTFMGQKKEVFRAQLKESPPLQSSTLSRNKSQKSYSNNPNANTVNESSMDSKERSRKSDVPVNYEEYAKTSQTSDMVLIIEPQTREFDCYNESKTFETVNVENNHLVTNWIDRHHEVPENSNEVMRLLLDEALDFIHEPLDDKLIDNKTDFMNQENDGQPVNLDPSISFKTVLNNDENYELRSDIVNALNHSFDSHLGDESVSLNDTRLTVTDFDMLSFKSVTSTSRFSEYLSADNELSNSQVKLITFAPTTSVQEIYERKDPPVFMQIPPSALATQVFSGFSLGAEPVPGDQIEPINFIDSETGSLAVDVNRLATSEELFISGRSSGSFESCLLDEDAVVPNWLFQIISQQQSAMDEMEAPAELIDPVPLAEPMYDNNGNVMEGPGAGAGAGDGRGIHSDHSQDSSGQGTSVSSSETSSGMQSEGVLIDPAAFAAQFELLQDTVDSSGMALAAREQTESMGNSAASSRQGPVETETHSLSCGESRRRPHTRSGGSDVDADVSSLDTDDLPDTTDY